MEKSVNYKFVASLKICVLEPYMRDGEKGLKHIGLAFILYFSHYFRIDSFFLGFLIDF